MLFSFFFFYMDDQSENDYRWLHVWYGDNFDFISTLHWKTCCERIGKQKQNFCQKYYLSVYYFFSCILVVNCHVLFVDVDIHVIIVPINHAHRPVVFACASRWSYCCRSVNYFARFFPQNWCLRWYTTGRSDFPCKVLQEIRKRFLK